MADMASFLLGRSGRADTVTVPEGGLQSAVGCADGGPTEDGGGGGVVSFEIDPVEDLAAAVDWFVEVIGARSDRPIERTTSPAGVARDLAEIDRRIVPSVLPAEIRWFWETWSPEGFVFLPGEDLRDPDFALDSWVDNCSEMDVPKALFPIGYEGHAFLLADLTCPAGTPASIWSWGFFDDELVCVAPSLASMMRASAECTELALPEPTPVAPAGDNWFGFYGDLFDGRPYERAVDRHFAASPHAARSHVPLRDRDRWPAAWRAAGEVMTGGSDAQGATHTVADFLAATADGTPRGRLRGQLEQMSGGLEGGSDYLMRLTDATGSIFLAVPPSRLPPGFRPGREIEVEAVGRGPVPIHPRRRPLDPAKLAQIEAEHGSFTEYLFTPEGRRDPDLAAALDEHLRALTTYKAQIPLVERTDLVDP
jgi:hypothetical protein